MSWLGQTISNVGTALHLPEMHISELFGNSGYAPATTGQAQLPSGGGGAAGGTTVGVSPYDPSWETGFSSTSTGPSGQILGANTTGGDSQPTQPTAPSGTPDISAELNAIFDPVFQAYNNQESSTNANYGLQTADINQQGQAAQSSLDTQQQTGSAQLNQLGTEAGARKEDALTAATRLYSELNRGGQQRFGGASSAGEAYGALTAVEQQRRQATIQTAYEGAMQKVAQFKNDLISKFADAKVQLQSAVQTQISAARQQFNDAISAIQTAKGEAQSAKAQASLQNLQDLRNKVFTINAQGVQAMQQLAANHQISLSAVDNYTQQVMNSISSGGTQVINMGNIANAAAGSTNLGISAGQTAPSTLQTGQTTSGRRWDEATQSWV